MKLVKPTIQFKNQYLEMLEDWKSTDEKFVPFSLKFDTTDFQKFIELNENHEKIPDRGFVCHSTFWLLDEDKNIIAGTSNIRHQLKGHLLTRGGHIGYGVRPSYRKQGYATKILELSLLEAKKLGIDKALVTCDKENIASKKTILNNGGVLREERVVEGEAILSFWIDIP